jgi:hypothetical protein
LVCHHRSRSDGADTLHQVRASLRLRFDSASNINLARCFSSDT